MLLRRKSGFRCRPAQGVAADLDERLGHALRHAVVHTLLALLQGKPFLIEPTVAYLGSLVFLAVVSTVVAFAAYLTLLGHIGPARAGYATVMFPVSALLISTALEGYQWTVYAVAGLVLVTMGNILVIRGGRR